MADQIFGPVVDALLDGNTKPLADWLRDGHPLDQDMAALLADMLDPQVDGLRTPFRLIVKGRKTGRQVLSEKMAVHDRNMEIGGCVEDALRVPAANYEAAVAAAKERFKVGRTKVTEALSHFRAQMNLEEKTKAVLVRVTD